MKTFLRNKWGILPSVLTLAVLYCLAIVEICAKIFFDKEGKVSTAAMEGIFSDWYVVSIIGISFCIAACSTLLVCALGLCVAVSLQSLRRGQRAALFMFHFPLSIPYAVAAIGMFFLLSQGGWLSRILAQFGLVHTPQDFPVFINDRLSLGVVFAYLWKQMPFAVLVFFSALRSLHEPYHEVARSLGARSVQRLWYVKVPLLTPSLISVAILCFTFTFSAYEIPALLGNTRLSMIAVLTFRFYSDANPLLADRSLLLSVVILLVNTFVVCALLFIVRCFRQRKFRQA